VYVSIKPEYFGMKSFNHIYCEVAESINKRAFELASHKLVLDNQ